MRRIVTTGLCCAAFAGALAAQAPQQAPQPRPLPGLIQEVRNIYKTHKGNITKAADQFPEDKYAWSPTPEVRTWGGLISHIIDDNNGACFVLAGETAPQPRLDNGGKPTEAGKDLKKADIVAKLAESFARCDKAFDAVTEANMAERNGTSNRSKFGAVFYNTQHINEHYGNIVTYMRLQGLVPPSSAPRGGGPAN
ncbi:MAG: DinB family protein [Acidobacteria bacterium]|nr:MAG: DinB family protein [Acidobacteriota bacterium]